jgi:cob(I)alamin adenosyltransferase
VVAPARAWRFESSPGHRSMLYTGKGDKGTTKLFGCDQQRISKSSEVPETLGILDELNAFLGFVKMRATHSARIAGAIRAAQENLFIVQAEVAGADKKIKKSAVATVEKLINDIEKEIPKIKGFSIAGGTELSALLDVARTIARRAERRIIAIKEANLRKISGETAVYMNRLSSLLFALARLANHIAGVAEENPKY